MGDLDTKENAEVGTGNYKRTNYREMENAIPKIGPAMIDMWKREYEVLLQKTPIARPQYITWYNRVLTDKLRAAWTLHQWKYEYEDGKDLLPPCVWCGQPTGNICTEECVSETTTERPPPECKTCELIFIGCPKCTRMAVRRQEKS